MVHTGDTFTVYILLNTCNNKRYVGCTRAPLKERFSSGHGYCHNQRLNADIKQYGWESFSHEVVASNLNYETASALEVETILLYHTNDPDYGYNVSTRVGAGLYGYVPRHSYTGWNKGRTASEETRRKMRESHLGIKQSLEWVKKRTANAKGRKLSEKRRAEIIPILKANADAKKRPCKTINVTTGEIRYYSSLKEASVETGCTCISHAIKTGAVRKGHLYEYVD